MADMLGASLVVHDTIIDKLFLIHNINGLRLWSQQNQFSQLLVLLDVLVRIRSLVSVHGHALRAAAQLTVSSRADGSAAGTTLVGAAFLESEKLLGTEGLVVDLRCRLDQILEVGSQKEVSEVDEFAVILVLNVDDTPAVLAAANLLPIDNDGLFGADDGKGNKALSWHVSYKYARCFSR